MAAIVGVTGDQPTVFDDDSLGNAGVSSAAQAVVDWFGQVDFLDIDAQFRASNACPKGSLRYDAPTSLASLWFGSPIQSIAAEVEGGCVTSFVPKAKVIPPFEIAHGDADCEVPLAQSQELHDALTKVGVSVCFTVVPGAGHADPLFYSKQYIADVAFLDAVFGMPR
jgi:acetyl esterase/lipase